MIIQRHGCGEYRPFIAQGGEEFFRMADARESEGAQALPIHPHLDGGQVACQVRQGYFVAPQGGKAGLVGGGADGKNEIGAGEASGYGFAQGACGDAAAIAKAGGGVHHDDGQRFGDAWVLKAVIQQDHGGPGGFSGLHACGAVFCHPCGGKGREQQRLIPHIGGSVVGGVNADRA